jgi:pimeloyl-ACP methyl ester carboxylesterase/DNA-binding CsgD family transcriptional regulator
MLHPAQEIRFCRSRDGTRIAYATCGAGPPLVWIGHWIRHLNHDWDSPIWRPWLRYLTSRFNVLRFDWRGCGLSDREGVSFSLEKHVEDLQAVVEAAGFKQFDLLASAAGAMSSIQFAAQNPGRVARLILLASQTQGHIARGMARGLAAQQAVEQHSHLKLMERLWAEQRPVYGKFYVAVHMPDASPEQQGAQDDLLRKTTTRDNALKLLRAFQEADVLGVVPQVQCPTLVMHARDDAIVPFDEGRRIASLIPGARFVPLESRNHVLLEGEPAWPRFIDAMTEFLPASTAASSAGRNGFVGELTRREHHVLELLAQGLDNGAIAAKLSISEKTVRNQVSTIFDKLGVHSRAQAVAHARDAGFGRNARGQPGPPRP